MKAGSHEANWLQRLQELTDFQDKSRHCAIPHNYSISLTLRSWGIIQRRAFNTGSMPEEHKCALDDIAFKLSLKDE
jgi:hypothetical protein